MKILCSLVVMAFFPAAAAPAQVLSVVIKDGDPIAGVGNVTLVNTVAVNDQGSILVECDTDNANTNIDEAVVKDGVLFLREGQALALPAGASIGSFDDLGLNVNGNSGWNFFLDGLTTTTIDTFMHFVGCNEGSSALTQSSTGRSSRLPALRQGQGDGREGRVERAQ